VTDINEKTVVITGGSRGIGCATARAFLAQGARVAVCALSVDRLRDAEQQLQTLGAVLAQPADVRDPKQVEAFVQAVRVRFGPVDVLVNNAGAAWSGEFVQEDYDSIDRVIDTNVKGVMIATRIVLPQMLARGAGVIINIASGAGLAGFAGLVSYCTSKYGVVGFTEALDLEVRDQGIRIYALCPGRVATDMQQAYSGHRAGMPPEEVAARIVELAGPHPRARTGTCVTLP